MQLGRSFFSLYFFIVVCFAASNWLLDQYWSFNVKQNVESYTGYKTVLRALNERLIDFPQEEWSTRMESATERFNLPLKVIPKENAEAIAPGFKVDNSSDITVYNKDTYITLFMPTADGSSYLVLGAVESPTRPRIETLYRTMIMVLLGIGVFVWIWPISKDLDKLNKSAKEFAQGDFKTKVDKGSSVIVKPMLDTFNMMSGRINSLIEAHKELTNAVSHELRTPLARSKFALQVLRGAQDDETRQRYIDKIATDVDELESLVNELLVYAAFESEQPNISFANVDVKTLVDKQVSGFSNETVNINCLSKLKTLNCDCDAHFINRAVSNLLTNAIKYGDGIINVSVAKVATNAEIIVEDNGQGVDDNFKEIIFNAFSRFDESRGKDTGGFGLGLAIVSKIMLWHNGSVAVEDSSLGGAKFILKLPIKHQ
ncbi:ATP-binding protein [Thalassotalea crassostreae]|uniref:ATP-binding protein n=1 Tax=Thalassotalea crassostreae TaxID=1763536 RepID=UPI000837F83D|nr:ATP-binding protein [Thalassotalea crassostreae]